MTSHGSAKPAGHGRRAVVIVALLAVACGSTVAPNPSGGTDGRPARSTLASPGPTSTGEGLEPLKTFVPGDDPAGGVSSSRPTPGGGDGGSRSSPGAPGAAAHAPGTACPVPVQTGTPGVTDQEIAVGAPRLTNVDAVTIGLEPSEADLDEYVEAMVEHVNSVGGIACRRVRVVWHDLDMAEHQTQFGPATEQAMCASWTQDDLVFAAFPGGEAAPYDVLYPCLDRAGVAIVDVRGISFRDQQGFAEVPRLIAVNSARLDRGTREQVHALARQGFLTADSRIGVVHYDGPRETRTVEQTLVPALAAHGLEVTERRAVTAPVSARDLPARQRDVANAALRFKLAGIDRVLFVRGAGLAATFMQAAEGNNYRPRYGLTSVELTLWTYDVPARQLVGTRGIGWLPESDLQPRRPESWPARRACLDFFRGRGFRTATTLDRIFAVSTCEAVWFLQAAVEAAPRPLSPDALVAGARGLGDEYESPIVRWTRFESDRRDGAATYRDVSYDQSCGCFVYTGPPRPLR